MPARVVFNRNCNKFEPNDNSRRIRKVLGWLDRSEPFTVELEPGYEHGVYAERWKVWIDLNANGDFEDANELAFF